MKYRFIEVAFWVALIACAAYYANNDRVSEAIFILCVLNGLIALEVLRAVRKLNIKE